ncbi:GNAT family N-acetyltransferase [Amycolatopsis tolypomycina]|uniref:GNAT family N-acetyltransferase n=1 Tax=Amycolatopsis tolypomycina TaxID=208445 RepID=UPI001FCA34EA|nr:GNAT family N-acetyltransferase [Amycolatopsis tolypomycina]
MTGTQLVRLGEADLPPLSDPRRSRGSLAHDDQFVIRPAHQLDLVALSSVGDRRYYADRLARQAASLGVLLTAWHSDRPVGDVYLWLEEAEEQPINRRLSGVPLLTHLIVREEARNRGIGSALIAAVENHVVALEHSRLALAVRTDNSEAARLYDRLGYRDWEWGPVVCHAERTLASGRIVLEPETCNVLVKNLG